MSVLLLMICLQIGKRIEEFEHLMIVHGYGRQIRSSQSTSHLRHWPASCSRVSTPAISATYLRQQASSAPMRLPVATFPLLEISCFDNNRHSVVHVSDKFIGLSDYHCARLQIFTGLLVFPI